MDLWRIKINSGRSHEVDWDQAKAYCRRAGVVGLGWGRPDVLADGAPIDEVVAAVEQVDGWVPTGPRIIRRLADNAHDGDLIWTRDSGGGYWLGRITGPWRYDGSDEAWRWDLNNIRPCEWLNRPFRDYDIPGAVVRNFAGRGETLRRINNDAAERVSDMLWRREHGDTTAWQPLTAEDVVSGVLDPIDVEDLVLLYLQAQGWLLLPSSRMHDTPMYEAALRRRDGKLAVVSVKSGPSAPVPIPELAQAAKEGGAQPFAYSTDDRYTVPPEDHGVEKIRTDQLLGFMRDDPHLLPPRISQWLTGEPASTAHTNGRGRIDGPGA